MTPQAGTTALLSHELRTTLGRLVRRLRAQGGTHFTQVGVLSRLEADGPASISDLAAAERMRPQSMAQTVGELEEAGLVSRRPDPGDRRRQLVELTELGRATLEETRARHEDWLTRTLERELDPHELDVVADAVALLRRVADAE